jgi:epoxyqueuosine reductase
LFLQAGNKSEIIVEAKRLGVDLIGFASVDRFSAAPENHKPTDIMAEAQSVIVLAQKCLTGPMKNNHWTSYTTVHEGNIVRLDTAAYYLSSYLEERYGAKTVPIPSMTPYFHWDEENQYAAGDLSHKHAAVAAGLGSIGKNTLLITPQYGNKVNLVSIIADICIEPDPIVEDNLCVEGCRLCVDSCPTKALHGDSTINQSACRIHCWAKLPRGFSVLQCWECRAVCPINKTN